MCPYGWRTSPFSIGQFVNNYELYLWPKSRQAAHGLTFPIAFIPSLTYQHFRLLHLSKCFFPILVDKYKINTDSAAFRDSGCGWYSRLASSIFVANKQIHNLSGIPFYLYLVSCFPIFNPHVPSGPGQIPEYSWKDVAS